MSFITNSEKETIELGKRLGKKLRGGEVFFLTGDLGGGKTQLTKGIALGLGIPDPITSPTFIYENIYQGEKLKLFHFDLYRSDIVDEDVKDLMLEAFDDQDGVTIVEWAERAKKYWPQKYYHFNFLWLDENKRSIEELSSNKGLLE